MGKFFKLNELIPKRNIEAFLLVCCSLFFFHSASAQENKLKSEVKLVIEEAVVFDHGKEVIQIDTNKLLQAAILSQKHNFVKEFVLIHRHIGDYFLNTAQYPKALSHYQIALKATGKLATPEFDIYLLEMRIANSYIQLRRIEDAQSIYLKHLNITEEKLIKEGADSSQLIYDKISILTNLGHTYSHVGQFEKAIPAMKTAYSLLNRTSYNSDSSFIAAKKEMEFHIGTAYLFKGDGKSAKPFILEHLDYIKINSRDFKSLAQAYGNYAYCEFLLNDFELAYENYFKSLYISQKNNFPYVSLVTYKDLSDTYKANGKLKEAFEYLKKHHSLKDSLQGIDIQQNIDNLKMEFETEQKEQEIIKLNQQNKIATQQRWLLIVALTLAFFIGLLSTLYLINLNKVRKKETELQTLKMANLNQELEYKKQDITRLALEITKKQDLAEQLSNQIKQLESHVQPDAKSELRKLGIVIQNHLHSSEEQKIFHDNIEAVNHAFYDKLSTQFPNLTKSDRELCSFIRLGLSNKEIAALRNLSPEAIRSSQFRLRKKLQLESKDDVEVFLQGF